MYALWTILQIYKETTFGLYCLVNIHNFPVNESKFL